MYEDNVSFFYPFFLKRRLTVCEVSEIYCFCESSTICTRWEKNNCGQRLSGGGWEIVIILLQFYRQPTSLCAVLHHLPSTMPLCSLHCTSSNFGEIHCNGRMCRHAPLCFCLATTPNKVSICTRLPELRKNLGLTSVMKFLTWFQIH